MWWIVGLFTIAGSALFFANQRIFESWSGTREKLGRVNYQYKIAKNRGRIISLKVGVDCLTGLNFGLKPESSLDRFFKSIGISCEQQLKNAEFDENIYVISDDKRLSYFLYSESALQQSMASMFRVNRWTYYDVKKLWCRGGRLWVEAKPQARGEETRIDLFIQEILPLLTELGKKLSEEVPKTSGSQDRFLIKAGAFIGLSAGLLVNGIIQLIYVSFGKFPVVLDHHELFILSMKVGFFALVFLCVMCIYSLGRTSRAHLILFELILIGGLGALTSAYAELREYNLEANFGSMHIIHTTVSQRYTTRCGKNGRSTCYHLVLARKDELTSSVELAVNSATYQQFADGGNAVVELHDGGLGFRWIDEPRAN